MNAVFTHRVLFIGLSLTLCFAIAVSILSGSVDIGLREVLNILVHSLVSDDALMLSDDMQIKQAVLVQIRLPRIVLAMITGLTLAVSGTVMQGLFRNPLADPSLIGVSSGASAGASLMIVMGGGALLQSGQLGGL